MYAIHVLYRVVQKKMHEVECTVVLQPFAVESRSFHQNAQKRLLSASQCKIYISWVKYSYINSWHWIHVISDVMGLT